MESRKIKSYSSHVPRFSLVFNNSLFQLQLLLASIHENESSCYPYSVEPLKGSRALLVTSVEILYHDNQSP